MKRNIFFLHILFFCISNDLYSKILIITHSYNRPDFIEIQLKTFKKFLHDDYEFVIFNDARDHHLRNAIKKMCAKLNLKTVSIPQKIHDKPYLKRVAGEDYNHPCIRCANVVQYSLDVLGFKHNDLVMIIDSDMFLIKDFSVKEYMESYDLAGVEQSRGHVTYLWNGLLFFNMRTLPERQIINFNCGRIEGQPTDVGGNTYYYLKNHPQLRVALFSPTYPQSFACNACLQQNNIACTHNTRLLREHGFNDMLINFIQVGPPNMEFILDKTFLHYRGGGNWDHKSTEYHKQKTKILTDFIQSILK